ncbi:MAG TPA: hypothetical protein VI997_00765 [Candidatus Thermoplasmatota archaeon]|nr:hypothetical protein [Candidatus Thermoplasmatota archaeon]
MKVALATLAVLVLVPVAASQSPPGWLGTTITADYDVDYTIIGRLEDADGHGMAYHAVTVGVDGPNGAVVKPLDLLTNCWGDFDAIWPLHNLTDRYTAKVTVDGQPYTQAVDVVHRRNDFAIRSDRSAGPSPECEQDEWSVSATRLTVVGQVLKASAPYEGPMGNTLYADPVPGVPVNIRYDPEAGGTSLVTREFANEYGAFRFSFLNLTLPVEGRLAVLFEDDFSQTFNETVEEDHAKYYVLSRPPAHALAPRGSPGPTWALFLVGAAVAASLLARRRAP